MARHNNNESYKLLELSNNSESDIELPELITSPRKKKVRRKLRRTKSPTTSVSQPVCACNIRIVSVWIVAFLLTTWIITLTWLAIVLHNEIQRLDSTVRQVVASSQGVPDALQKCHTISKSLQQNQTLMTSQINVLKLHLENVTKDISSIQIGFNKIQEKLNNAPLYIDVPQQLKEVSNSIANLGSQIKDITTTVTSLKESKEKLQADSDILQQNVTILRQSVLNLQNLTQVPVTVNSKNNADIENMLKVINGIKNNVTDINSTLSNNIQWIKDDLKKNNKNIESISNTGQNMSARVTTLEGICGKTSSDQITLSTNFKTLSDEVKTLTNNVQTHSTQLNELQTQIYHLNQNSSELISAINHLNHSIDENNNNNNNNKLFTPATYQQESYHERDLTLTNNAKLKTESPPQSTMQQASVQPTQETSETTAKDLKTNNNPTGKPAILSA